VVIAAGDADADKGGPGEAPTEEEKLVVTSGVMAGRVLGSPGKTLQEARFVIGDFVDVAVFAPGADGSVAAPPTGGPARPGREFAGRGGYGSGVNGVRDERGGGYGGFRGRGRGVGEGRLNGGGVPVGEWRRGEQVPPGGRGWGRGRGRGF